MNPLAPTIYGFSTTKVAGIKSKMLDSRFYRSALSTKSVGGILELLRDTPYAPYIGLAKNTRELSKALHSRIVDLAKLLRKYVPKKDYKAYDAFLLRYDFMALKKVVSALARGQSWEEVEPTLEGALYPVRFWRRFFGPQGNRALKSFLGMSSVSMENLPEAVERIDRMFLMEQEVLRNRPSYEFIVKDVDITNLLSLLSRGKNAKFSLFGKISKQKLEMAKSSEKERERLLGSFGLGGNEAIPEAQMKLEMMYARKKKARFYTTLFSLDRVLLCLMMLEEEARNVRKIALSKELGVDAGVVNEVLVL